MEALPIPKNKQSILASLVLIVIAFSIYYLWPNGYKAFQKLYIDGMYLYPYSEQNKIAGNVIIYINVPKFTSDAIPGDAYIKVANNGGTEITDLQIRLELLDSSGKLLLPPATPTLFRPQAQIYERAINLGTVKPHSVITGRFLLASDAPEAKLHVTANWLSKDNGQLTPCTADFPVPSLLKFDSGKALVLSFTQYVLLPPWSNGLIPALVLLACWFADPEDTNKKPKTRPVTGTKNASQDGSKIKAFQSIKRFIDKIPITFMKLPPFLEELPLFVQILINASIYLLCIVGFGYIYFSLLWTKGTDWWLLLLGVGFIVLIIFLVLRARNYSKMTLPPKMRPCPYCRENHPEDTAICPNQKQPLICKSCGKPISNLIGEKCPLCKNDPM